MKTTVLTLLLCAVAAHAQMTPAPLPDIKAILEDVSKSASRAAPAAGTAEGPAGERTFSQALLSRCFDSAARDLDKDLRKDCRELEVAAFAHARASLEYDREIYAWQLRSTVVLFWVVMALVAGGMVFAALQFVRAMRPDAAQVARRAAASGAAAAGPALPAPLGGDIEISAKGLRVSSSVLGVIVLVISMAFLYLYLTIAYPITQAGK